jgi:Uma2 family endonuclease
MAVVAKGLRKNILNPVAFGLEHNSIVMTVQEFDAGEFDERFDYELINGILIVTPPAHDEELIISEELNHLLRSYRDMHPEGWRMITTLSGRYVLPSKHRLRADRVIWAGLRRFPKHGERPTIVIDIPTLRIRRRARDYQMRCAEFLRIGVKEYWIIDRIEETLTVSFRNSNRRRIIHEDQDYETPLLPGFQLPLNRLFAHAAEWARNENEDDSEDI